MLHTNAISVFPALRMPALMLAFLALALAQPAAAAPKAELWERWTAHAPASEASIDHAAWDGLLKTYLRENPRSANLFAYGDFSAADRETLAIYIASLEAVAISDHKRGEQLAYWINLYNALTVRVILDHYPVSGIRKIDISPGWFSDGPWGKELVTVEGEALSLDDIEHRILRPIWRDPRIHYAVNCASIGCPDLMTRAVTADNAEAYMAAGGRNYVNDERGARIRDGRLYASSIYDWFEEDFAADGGVIAHLKLYAEPPLAAQLATIDAVSGHDYNWSLNDARPVTPVTETDASQLRTFGRGGS